MYDNIIIKANLQSIGREDFFVKSQSFPNSIIEDKDGEAAKVVFYCRNLKVIVTAEKVVIRGSICKYHLRTNQYTLTRHTTEEAFKELSEELQLPIHLFNVMYFEFESNLVVDRDVQSYYAFLGNCKGFKRKGRISSSIYYENTYRRLLFYDKIKQINRCKREQAKVIKEFKGKNVLRFGVRYLKTVCKKFSRSSILVSDLYTMEFYQEVVNRWRQEYFNIVKYKVKTFDDLVFKNTKKMIEQYAILGILANGGQAEALERIKQADEKQIFRFAQQKQRHLSAINNLFKDESLFKDDESIRELDRKINEEAERHLAD